MSIRMDRVLRVIPKEDTTVGRRNVLRNRPDVGELVCDLILNRRTLADISRRCAVSYDTVLRFRKQYCTDEVRRVVLAEAKEAESRELDDAINEGQDDIQRGLYSIIREQKEVYQLIKAKLGEGRDIEDLVPALAQLLRDQGQSFERLAKSYAALKEKTTVTISINESPEWGRLQDVLFLVFEAHPEAFEMFRQLTEQRRLRLG